MKNNILTKIVLLSIIILAFAMNVFSESGNVNNSIKRYFTFDNNWNDSYNISYGSSWDYTGAYVKNTTTFKIGNSSHHTGTSGFRINESSIYSKDKNYSFSVWSRVNDIVADSKIIAIYSNDYQNSFQQGWVLLYYGNTIYFRVFNNSAITTDITSTISINTWYNTVINYNTTDKKYYFYINNTEIGSAFVYHSYEYNATNFKTGLQIARDDNLSVAGHKGVIDELGIFNKILTLNDISYLYNSGNAERPNLLSGPLYFSMSAIYSNNGSSISIFNASIDGYNYNTTNGTITTNYTTNMSNKNIIVFGDGLVNRTYTNYNLSTPLVANMTLSNSLLVNIYYENNLSLITDSVTLNIYSDSYSNNYTITSGTQFLNNIPEGTYTINVYSTTFPLRSYYITITNTTSESINIYLLSSGSLWSTNTKNEQLLNLPGVLIKLQRYFSQTNSYIQVDQCLTNDFGNCNFYILTNNYFYKLIFEYNNRIVFETSPSRITDITTYQNFVLILNEDVLKSFFKMNNVYTNLYFTEVTNTSFIAKYTFDNTDNYLIYGCIEVYKRNILEQDTLVCENCVNASSGTAICSVTREPYNYFIYGKVHTNSNHSIYPTDIINLDKLLNDISIDGKTRFFFSFLIFVPLAILGIGIGGFAGGILGIGLAGIILSFIPFTAQIGIGIIATIIFIGLLFSVFKKYG